MIARIRPETRYNHLLQSLFTGKDYHAILEADLKAYFGVEEVLFTQGGRVGLYYLLKALPQKKVYLPAYTCWAVPDATGVPARNRTMSISDSQITIWMSMSCRLIGAGFDHPRNAPVRHPMRHRGHRLVSRR